MQLDRLAARIRPRTGWEGLDLGFAMGRRWFPALWGLWWLCALPLGAAAAIWLPERPDLWILLVWWFKPLYEAPLLFWLSRALFGSPPSPRLLWQERGKVLPLRLLLSLLWRRFHASRSLQFPLIQLEGLSGRERRQRQRLIQGTGGTCTWLTVICVHLESILWASALVLALFMVPDQLPRLDLRAALLEVDSAAYWISALLYWLAMSVMAPFYVAAGFAFYLTRRTELEAWDLELVFRQPVPDERKRRPPTPIATGSATLLALMLWVVPSADAAVQPLNPDEARALVTDVLAGPDFGDKQELWVWVYRGTPEEDSDDAALPDWLHNIVRLIAEGADALAGPVKWVFVLGAALICALVLRRILLDLRRRRPDRSAPPEPDQIRQLRALASGDDLPADIEAQIGRLLAAEDPRGALALLYRASLSRLTQRHGLHIPASATESECLDLVAGARPAHETALLQYLSDTWQRLAYGHRPPASEAVTTLLRNWRHWHGNADET